MTAVGHLHLSLRAFGRAGIVRQLMSEYRAEGPSAELLERLVWAWGNEKFAASPEYLAEMVEAARRADGPVLECGSGVSTLLLGIESDEVYSLEHDPYWARRSRAWLARLGIRATVLDAPLRSYGDFTWYDVPELPDSFALVVCDGPPAYLCGRYGLFPVLGERIAGDVLLDDVYRREEQVVVARWADEYGVSAETVDCAKPYARLSGSVVGNRVEPDSGLH